MTRKGKSTDLGRELSKLASKLDRKGSGALLQVKVNRAWSAVAGESVAAHTAGSHLRDKQLIVYVDSPVWATELSALSEHYRVAMNEEIGEEAVKEVRFTVSRQVAEKRREEQIQAEDEEFYGPDRTEAVPLSPQERAQVEASAAGIADEELREAVVRATVADLEWKKGLKAEKSRQEPREAP